MSAWNTRLPPERTRAVGVAELHAAWFLPRKFPGSGPVVALSLPECEIKYVPGIEVGGVPIVALFDRRSSVACAIKDACKIASADNACLLLLTDTAEQLEPAVRLAARRLPHHTRAALERMDDPATRALEKLN